MVSLVNITRYLKSKYQYFINSFKKQKGKKTVPFMKSNITPIPKPHEDITRIKKL